MEPLPPLYTAPLFRPLLAELLLLLRGLPAEAWTRPTVAGRWRVRDVAAHLLDGDLRKVAAYRDGHAPAPDRPIRGARDLGDFINALNAGGVAYAARLSPRLLVDLLEVSGDWVADVLAELPPHGPSLFAVSWAGEAASENWMDAGREYTERWHHQMQIRDAVGEPRLLEPAWMQPLIELSLRALPHAYREVDASPGTAVTVEVHGPTAGAWSVVCDGGRWRVVRGRPRAPAAVVEIAADDLWRLLYNALPEPAVAERVRVRGAAPLAAPLLRARSVVL